MSRSTGVTKRIPKSFVIDNRFGPAYSLLSAWATNNSEIIIEKTRRFIALDLKVNEFKQLLHKSNFIRSVTSRDEREIHQCWDCKETHFLDIICAGCGWTVCGICGACQEPVKAKAKGQPSCHKLAGQTLKVGRVISLPELSEWSELKHIVVVPYLVYYREQRDVHE